MHVTPFQQRVRNALASFEARWHGRAPTLDQLAELLAPAPTREVHEALQALAGAGYVHRTDRGWHSKPAGTTFRAAESFATHSRLQPTHY
jgi:hypothetical protein